MKRRQFIALTATATAAQANSAFADQPILSFGLTTDVQYVDADPEGERHFRESIPKLKAAVADLATEKLPFTLHLGDVVDREFSSFAAILPLFNPLGHPVRHLLGNHDFEMAEAEKLKVAATLGIPADHYTFTESGVKFIMLDTNDISTYKHPEGSAQDLAAETVMQELAAAGAKNAKPWNGGLSQIQLDWLDKELTSSDANKQPTLICGHHPLMAEEGHHAWKNRDIIAIIERHPSALAYFCGHNHKGGQTVLNGVPYITFKSLLHEPNITAYAVIRLFAGHLVIEGRGREASRQVPLRKI